MKKTLLIFLFICFQLNAQDEITADWEVSVDGNEVTISIIEFNNFTVGLDGHWHYILNNEEYVAVHDINDVVISGLPDGEHMIYIWLVDHMHNSLDPPVEETIYFDIDTGLSINNNKIPEVLIYPNPVKENYITITSPLEGPKEIKIYTIAGKKILDTRINGNTLDISSINSGFYILKVTINNQSKLSKLIIK